MGMKYAIEVNGKRFESKMDCINYTKSILNKYEIGAKLNKEDHDFVCALIEFHPNSVSKVGNGIEKLIVKKASYGTRCFYILRKDGTTIDFSFLGCISPGATSTKRNLLSTALRKVIYRDTIDFKSSKSFKLQDGKDYLKCELCGMIGMWDEMQVDHDKPNTFKEIVTSFILANPGVDSAEITIEDKGTYIDTEFVDKSIPDLFIDMHNKMAKLRVLCKHCNLTRPK